MLVNRRDGALTKREHEVLTWVARGRTNAEIGEELFIGEETVRSHMKHILRSLGARNRAHAVTIGFLNGLLTTTLPSGKSSPSD